MVTNFVIANIVKKFGPTNSVNVLIYMVGTTALELCLEAFLVKRSGLK